MTAGPGRGHRSILIPVTVCSECLHAVVYGVGIWGAKRVALVRCTKGHWRKASLKAVENGRRDRYPCEDFQPAGGKEEPC